MPNKAKISYIRRQCACNANRNAEECTLEKILVLKFVGLCRGLLVVKLILMQLAATCILLNPTRFV